MQLRSASVRPAPRQMGQVDAEAVGHAETGPFTDHNEQGADVCPCSDVVGRAPPGPASRSPAGQGCAGPAVGPPARPAGRLRVWPVRDGDNPSASTKPMSAGVSWHMHRAPRAAAPGRAGAGTRRVTCAAAHHRRLADADLPHVGGRTSRRPAAHAPHRGRRHGRGQFEHLPGGQRVARAAQTDPGLGGLAAARPRIPGPAELFRCHSASADVSERSGDRRTSNGVSWPASSTMPTCAASARTRGPAAGPSVRRVTSTSWNDRLW